MPALLSWFVIGASLAVVAWKALPVKDPDGPLLTFLIGIAGALLGGFLSVATKMADSADTTTAHIAAAAGSAVDAGLEARSVHYERKHSVSSQVETPATRPKATGRPSYPARQTEPHAADRVRPSPSQDIRGWPPMARAAKVLCLSTCSTHDGDLRVPPPRSYLFRAVRIFSVCRLAR